ncbi:MAG: hypothetical protein WAM97_18425 [Acidimicrobiales bacterium]
MKRQSMFRTSGSAHATKTGGRVGRVVVSVALVIAGTVAAFAYASVSPALAASTPSDCAWGARSGADTVNVADPDTSANYWAYTYTAVPDTELIIKGTYPRARYFSFVVYQEDTAPIGSIYDAQIQPDPGSGNPFVGPVAKHSAENYTVTVLFTSPPAQPAPNTLYAGQSNIDGTTNPGGSILLRTYVPQDESTSPQGSVPFPTVTWETTSGTVLDAGAACARTAVDDDVIAQELNSQSFPVEPTSGSSTAVTWSRTASTGVGFPNPQNAYLTATISRDDGDLVVVHGLAPTFPNTTAGVPVYTPSQLRYWSICVNNQTTQVISCTPDYQTSLVDGYYTYVISDPSVRPKNATTRKGVAWLPWGSTDLESVIFLRNMLPASNFPEAVQNVSSASGSPSAQQVMGAYYPEAVYCAPATFETGGWKACFAAVGQ